MKEFRDAHAFATGNRRNKFLIPILFDDVNTGDLDADLRVFLENHTYIPCNNSVSRDSLLQQLFLCFGFLLKFLTN